jgi:periplasmic divalent cation tolerance protein
VYEPVELVLTCADRAEAEKIADTLLDKHLIACAKFVQVDSKYRWQGKLETDKETLLLMESLAANFNQVENEISKLHSYDTFVLKQLAVTKLSKKADAWLRQETKSKG